MAPTDLFALGRAATSARRALHGDRGVFARSRQLMATGAWRGPRDAALAYVEHTDLPALGGLGVVCEQGVRCLLVAHGPGAAELARQAANAGLRVVWRLPFHAGEAEAERTRRLDEVAQDVRAGLAVDGVLPSPQGEPLGLDTLTFFARCRLALDVPHLMTDCALLGHRLAQMSLGFGADELFGPIVSERALRLGANANNPAMTRKEAALLLTGAGLVPCERTAGGTIEEYQP